MSVSTATRICAARSNYVFTFQGSRVKLMLLPLTTESSEVLSEHGFY